MQADAPGAAARRGPARWMRIAGAAGLLAFVLWWVGPRGLWAQLEAAAPGWFAAAVAIGAAANGVSAWRWARLARALGLRAPLAPLTSAYAQGITANVLLPGATLGGDALRSFRLAQLGNPLGTSALSVLLDRASGLWVLCVLSLGAAAFCLAAADASLPAAVEPAWIWLYVAALLAVVSLPWWPWSRRVNDAERGWRTRAGRRIAEWHELVVTRRSALAASLLPSLLVQVLSATALWACARAAGGTVDYGAVLMIAAPVFAAAAIPVSVGGFGPREFAATAAFALIGAAPAAGAAAALLYGLTAVVQGVLAAPLLVLARGGSPSAAR
jgi:hypothetical protein